MKIPHHIFTPGWKLFIPFIIFQLSFLCCFSNGGWMRDITDAGFFRSPTAIAASDGGYLLAGYVSDPTGGNLNYPLLLKTDAKGNEVWRKSWPQFGIASIDALVQETTNGGFILGAIGIDGHFVVKVNAGGETVWMRDLGVQTKHITQTADGGYIVVAIKLPPAWGVIKLNADGSEAWRKFYMNGQSGTGFYCGSIDQTADGGYVVGGTWVDMIEINNTYYNQSYPAMIRLDAMGDTIWSKMPMSNAWGAINYIKEAAGGGYYANGVINGNQFVKLGQYGTFEWGLNDCPWPNGFSFVETVEASDTAVVVVGHTTNTIRMLTADGSTTIWEDNLGLRGRSVQQAHDGGFIITADDDVNDGSTGSTLYLIKTESRRKPRIPFANTVFSGVNGNALYPINGEIKPAPPAPDLPTQMEAVAYPNPFNYALHVECNLPVAANVTVRLLNLSGEAITLAENQNHAPGSETFVYKPPVPPGVYLLEITSGNSRVVQRVVKE